MCNESRKFLKFNKILYEYSVISNKSTIPVCSVWILTLDTCSVGVALQGRGAHAHGAVVVDPAHGALAALLQVARVAALLADTCEVLRTFRVRHAFRLGC